MELCDIQIKHLKNAKRNNQLVIVDFDSNGEKCLVFLVEDSKSPQVPGYPAESLSYFDTVRDAREAIVEKYKQLNYFPKHKTFEGTFS